MMEQPTMFRVEDPDPRLRAVLEVHGAHERTQSLRRMGTAALAVAGGGLWASWGMGGAAMRYLAVAAWLTLLSLTLGAGTVEFLLWRRLKALLMDRRV